MLSIKEKNIITDVFSDLLGLAACSHINLQSIEEIIWVSDFAKELDAGYSKILLNKTSQQLFNELFGDIVVVEDEDTFFDVLRNSKEYKIFSWVGWAYMQLYFHFQKPISYTMLVMSMKLMANLYSVYHEMDITQLFKYFEDEAKSNTLLKRTMNRRKISAPKLSMLSGVSLDTINYYKKSDSNLYNAKFQNIYPLSLALRITSGLFLEKIYALDLPAWQTACGVVAQ